jgi:hypothetical protein
MEGARGVRAALPSLRPELLHRVMGVWGFLVAAALVAVMTALSHPFDPSGYGPGHDARAYWSAPLGDPYQPGSVGQESAFLYSPAFLVAVSPLKLLPWPLFVAAWTTILLLVLLWMVRPTLFLPMIALTLPELWGGNITILMAAALVLGFRTSAAWAFPLLTKLTPGVGVIWYAVRREWVSFGIAVAATALAIAGAALVTPFLWSEWLALLVSSTDSSTVPGSIAVPLAVRLPLAVLVIAWAAHRGERWLLPVGVLLAMPVVWWGSLSMLTACVALRREEIEDLLADAVAFVETRLRGRLVSAS